MRADGRMGGLADGWSVGRLIALLAVLLSAYLPNRLSAYPPIRLSAAQCPDGTPPPCRGARAAAAPAFSVAVLSFENRSRDSADAFLGDGLADEIAAQLGGVERLTVRSRTMVRRLAGAQTMAPSPLGRALGAAYLVDGSIQRAGTQLRVQVALLRSASGEQAWAQTYDRPAADLFRIQSDIAQAVSEAIAGRLLPRERAVLTREPTRNAAAYQLYVRARQAGYSSRQGDVIRSIADLEQAVALDSTFADAWARLAWYRLVRWWVGTDRTEGNLASARGAAERAVRLGPDRVEPHVAMGYYHYWSARNYPAALVEFNAALRLRPNDPSTWDAMASISRRLGEWERSLEQRQRVAALEPGDPGHQVDLSMTLSSMRRWPEAIAAADSAERLGGDSLLVAQLRAFALLGWRGVDAARPEFHRVMALYGRSLVITQAPDASWFFRRDPVFQAWVDRLVRPADGDPVLGFWYAQQETCRLGAGDSIASLLWGDSVRMVQERELARDSTNIDARIGLAYTLAFLGRYDDAMRESDRVMRELPLSRDGYTGGEIQVQRAWLLNRGGRTDEALTVLERAMSMNAGHAISKSILREDPAWANLRGNPRFERLISIP